MHSVKVTFSLYRYNSKVAVLPDLQLVIWWNKCVTAEIGTITSSWWCEKCNCYVVCSSMICVYCSQDISSPTKPSVVRSAPDGVAIQPCCYDGLTNAQRMSLIGSLLLLLCMFVCWLHLDIISYVDHSLAVSSTSRCGHASQQHCCLHIAYTLTLHW